MQATIVSEVACLCAGAAAVRAVGGAAAGGAPRDSQPPGPGAPKPPPARRLRTAAGTNISLSYACSSNHPAVLYLVPALAITQEESAQLWVRLTKQL